MSAIEEAREEIFQLANYELGKYGLDAVMKLFDAAIAEAREQGQIEPQYEYWILTKPYMAPDGKWIPAFDAPFDTAEQARAILNMYRWLLFGDGAFVARRTAPGPWEEQSNE